VPVKIDRNHEGGSTERSECIVTDQETRTREMCCVEKVMARQRRVPFDGTIQVRISYMRSRDKEVECDYRSLSVRRKFKSFSDYTVHDLLWVGGKVDVIKNWLSIMAG